MAYSKGVKTDHWDLGEFSQRAVAAHGGRGRDWLDNVYVERPWRSIKQEEVYQCAYET